MRQQYQAMRFVPEVIDHQVKPTAGLQHFQGFHARTDCPALIFGRGWHRNNKLADSFSCPPPRESVSSRDARFGAAPFFRPSLPPLPATFGPTNTEPRKFGKPPKLEGRNDLSNSATTTKSPSEPNGAARPQRSLIRQCFECDSAGREVPGHFTQSKVVGNRTKSSLRFGCPVWGRDAGATCGARAAGAGSDSAHGIP
jgi:hypothetical protein